MSAFVNSHNASGYERQNGFIIALCARKKGIINQLNKMG